MAKILEAQGAKLDLVLVAGLNRADDMEVFYDVDDSLTVEGGALYRARKKNRTDVSDEEILAQALVYACLYNNVEADTLLLDRGADIDVMTPVFDLTANGMQWAARRGKTEVAKLMIERGADLTQNDRLLIFESFSNGGEYTGPRKIKVYLPDNYQNSDNAYPVIYFHDGMTAFTRPSVEGPHMGVEHHYDALVQEGFVEYFANGNKRREGRYEDGEMDSISSE